MGLDRLRPGRALSDGMGLRIHLPRKRHELAETLHEEAVCRVVMVAVEDVLIRISDQWRGDVINDERTRASGTISIALPSITG